MTCLPPQTREQYDALYHESLTQPDQFWGRMATLLDWDTFPTQIKNTSFTNPIHIDWYEDGKLNAAFNCVDRHAMITPDKIAFIVESDSGEKPQKITYRDLLTHVTRFAHILKNQGISAGDRVLIYLPMIPEAVYAMLACARMGAIHTVVFAGFSPDALAGRIHDCTPKLIITADEGLRGGKKIPLKANIDIAREKSHADLPCVVIKHTDASVPFDAQHDIWFHECTHCDDDFPCHSSAATDPLFILYTSGSTGKPKGVLHSTGGYLVYAALTFSHIFRTQQDDIFFCTADIGWITGHSYLVYGPLAMGATIVLFEGIPTSPDMGRFWDIIDKHQVTHFYTAPTAIRALMREGDDWVKKYKRTSLKLLGSVGEPINPEAWHWYDTVVGDSRCPIVDTWWQTETGGILISPQPGLWPTKAGAATLPFYGVKPIIMDTQGQTQSGVAEGPLCIESSWPGQMISIYGDHQRFEDTYFKTYPGYYVTGDGARRDEDGFFWITGRIDDVLNVSGHRLGTAEIESALVGNTKVAEAAVVGYPHPIKGQGIYCYVILKNGFVGDEKLRAELIHHVRTVISPIAQPDIIHWVPNLPKTRSGKIMRRILRKIAEGDTSNLGDLSTLADPSIVDQLIKTSGE